MYACAALLSTNLGGISFSMPLDFIPSTNTCQGISPCVHRGSTQVLLMFQAIAMLNSEMTKMN